MAVRTKFLAADVLTNAGAVLYTTPAGETTIIKWVTLSSSAAIGSTIASLFLNIGGTNFRVLTESVGAASAESFVTWWVLAEGDSLLGSSPGGVITGTFHGTELEGVAD